VKEGAVGSVSFKKALEEALKGGPATAAQLLDRMRVARIRTAYPITSVKVLARRLASRCRAGMAAQLLVGNRNVFVSAAAVQEAARRFDLQDPTARLIAADWLEEQGQGELAGLLRRARRFTCGP
jgi:uncharacterized protein (TIGR02996 family)